MQRPNTNSVTPNPNPNPVVNARWIWAQSAGELWVHTFHSSQKARPQTLTQGRRGGRRAAAGCGGGGQELGEEESGAGEGGRVEWVGLAAARPGPGGQ